MTPRRGNVAQRAVPGGEGSALAPFQELTETLSTLDLYRGESGDGRAGSWTVCEESGAWVRFPDTTPWGVVYFIGGAGFGTYPHVAYDSLLGKLSTACGGGLVAIAWPYDVGLNHVQIAKDAAAGFETALARFSERESWSPRLKEFSIGHSLGAKLQLLNAVDLCAEGDEGGEGGERVSPPNNLALISLNNAGIADSLPLALRFLSTVNAGAAGAAQQFDFIVQLAKTAVEASGLEFYPSPTVTEAFVADSELDNVAVFRFDDDDLDQSRPFFDASGPERVGFEAELEGQHLSPIYIKLSAEKLADAIPPEALNTPAAPFFENLRESKEAFIVGDEATLDALVDELAGWMGIPGKGGKGAVKQPALLTG